MGVEALVVDGSVTEVVVPIEGGGLVPGGVRVWPLRQSALNLHIDLANM